MPLEPGVSVSVLSTSIQVLVASLGGIHVPFNVGCTQVLFYSAAHPDHPANGGLNLVDWGLFAGDSYAFALLWGQH